MNNNLKCLLAFTLGAAVGVAASWKLMEAKYRKIADEEIESVKEVFSTKPVEEDTEESDGEDDADEEQEEPEMEENDSDVVKEDNNEYHKIIQQHNYHNNYSVISKEGDASNGIVYDAPYIIDAGEVGELDYEVIELIYYEGDKVLADELDEIVDDVEGTVGLANLEQFDECDSIYVRNDTRRVDYEILLDVREFAEATYLRKFEY